MSIATNKNGASSGSVFREFTDWCTLADSSLEHGKIAVGYVDGKPMVAITDAVDLPPSATPTMMVGVRMVKFFGITAEQWWRLAAAIDAGVLA